MAGRGDFRADMYSLGCTLFFALANQDPFPSDRITDSQLGAPPRVDKHDATLARPLVKLVERMMQPNPKDRFDDYPELLAGIDALLAQPRLLHRDNRPKMMWAGIAVLAAAAIAFLWRMASYG